jgi:hypothetical protein
LQTSSEQLSGKLPLKCAVSTSTRRTVPRAPSCITHQSWPGPRLRLVSHPSLMSAARPGMMRLWRWPKNSSEVATTSPPCSTAAKSTSPPARLTESQSGATSP